GKASGSAGISWRKISRSFHAARCAASEYRRDGEGAGHHRRQREDALIARPPHVAGFACPRAGRKLEQPIEFCKGEKAMVVTCEEMWREISNYIEEEVDPALRAAMEEHFSDCKHCTAVLVGTRNVIQLYGDERLLEVPVGFSGRLRSRWEMVMPVPRGNAWGWMVAVAAAALITIGGVAGRSSAFNTPLRSE